MSRIVSIKSVRHDRVTDRGRVSKILSEQQNVNAILQKGNEMMLKGSSERHFFTYTSHCPRLPTFMMYYVDGSWQSS